VRFPACLRTASSLAARPAVTFLGSSRLPPPGSTLPPLPQPPNPTKSQCSQVPVGCLARGASSWNLSPQGYRTSEQSDLSRDLTSAYLNVLFSQVVNRGDLRHYGRPRPSRHWPFRVPSLNFASPFPPSNPTTAFSSYFRKDLTTSCLGNVYGRRSPASGCSISSWRESQIHSWRSSRRIPTVARRERHGRPPQHICLRAPMLCGQPDYDYTASSTTIRNARLYAHRTCTPVRTFELDSSAGCSGSPLTTSKSHARSRPLQVRTSSIPSNIVRQLHRADNAAPPALGLPHSHRYLHRRRSPETLLALQSTAPS